MTAVPAQAARRGPRPIFGLRLLGFGVLLLLWIAVSTFSAGSVLPNPLAVLASLSAEIASGELWIHLGATLGRVGMAFVLALAIGSALGIWMGMRERADQALDGLLIVMLNLPALVVMILCYVWLGLTDVAAVLAVALNKIPTVVVTLREGARALDTRLLDVGRVYRVSAWARIRHIVIPQLLPYALAAARTGLALIWKIVLVVELIGRPNGVGFKLGNYFHFFDLAGVLAYTLAFVAVVLLFEWGVLRPAERRLLRWRT